MSKTKLTNGSAPEPSATEPPSQAAIQRQAKLRAAAVLEVLAGERTPTKAAQALGVTLPRYYLMEAQALQGLVAACALKPKGRVKKPVDPTERLARENNRLKQMCARYQTLLRAAQRAVGLSPPKPTPADLAGKRRKRKPMVRALRAASRLQSEATQPAPAAPPSPQSPLESTGHGPSTRTVEPGRSASGP